MNHKENKGKLGEILLKKGVITEKQLEKALKTQQAEGSKLGEILIGMGAANRFEVYQALAEHYKLPFVDLQEQPIDASLFEKKHRDIYLNLGLLPWKKDKGQIVIASAGLEDEVRAWAADHFKNYRFVITSPFDILWAIQNQCEEQDDEDAKNLLWKQSPELSAKKLFDNYRGKTGAYILIGMALLLFIFWKSSLANFFIFMNLFYVFALLFKALFFFYGYHARTHEKEIDVSGMDDKRLPIYTLLIPLFREREATIHNLVSAIRGLDYPKSKLDVKLIVETGDRETIDALKNFDCESYFEIIEVPFSYPQTKPKACNYALKFAKGEYVTIYDAEDIPDADQLKKVLYTFWNSPPNLACVQARLNYFNREENLLTRMFSIEYGAWFDFMLLGLEHLCLPIPLGGTSNHFRVDMLRKLYAWDPYNVTEDADLGIRLSQLGLKTTIVASYTMEECPVDLKNWFKQRSRWIKGYIQTYFVHMRSPLAFLKKAGVQGFFGFQFFVGAPSVVFITMPLIFFISLFAMLRPELIPSGSAFLAVFNFVAGVLLHAAFAWSTIKLKGWKSMEIYCFIFPFYWLMHMLASFRAVWQLIERPHYWDKTEHGLTKMVPNHGTI